MSEILSRFSFDAAKVDYQMWALMALIWLAVLGCAVGSVFSHQHFNSRQRWFWISVIVCIPGFGLLAYLPFSVRREGYSSLHKPKSKSNRLGTSSS